SGGCCIARCRRGRPFWCACRAGATRTSTRSGRPLPPPDLEARLRERVGSGGRAFVAYVMGGLPGVDAELLRGLQDAGADAIEVGIPFSDPVMDGPVIQRASQRALESGATFEGILAEVRAAALDVPVVAMTYLNPVLAMGFGRFVEAASGLLSGVIVPDLPVDEA